MAPSLISDKSFPLMEKNITLYAVHNLYGNSIVETGRIVSFLWLPIREMDRFCPLKTEKILIGS